MHKADVRTAHGLTLEFQHSYLKAEERTARENFYGNMIWVVDGARVPRNFRRFVSGMSTMRPFLIGRLFLAPFPEESFPPNWLDCRVPVILDFGNAVTASDAAANAASWLWCLLPERVLGNALVVRISREEFLKEAHRTAEPMPTEWIKAKVTEVLTLQQQVNARLAVRATSFPGDRRTSAGGNTPGSKPSKDRDCLIHSGFEPSLDSEPFVPVMFLA